ncbi:MAG: serine/threonine-protein phosphatase [Treponemataceae bacterium]|nr:serine/threonine-protein phosphatase [Treponemataceae bacterium]
MVYVFINAVFAVMMLRLSLSVDAGNSKNETSIVNLTLLSAAFAFLMGIITLVVLKGPQNLAVFLEHSELFLIGLFYTFVGMCFLRFVFEKNSFISFLQFVFVALALFISAMKISVDDYRKLSFVAESVFPQAADGAIKFTWLDLYYAIFIFLVPGFSLLILMVYTENARMWPLFQRSVFFAGALVLSWIGFLALLFGAVYVPLIISLSPIVICLVAVILVRSSACKKLYTAQMLIHNLFRMIMEFALPAAIGAGLYLWLRPLHRQSHFVFYAALFVSVALLAFGIRALIKKISTIIEQNLSMYGEAFEADLVAINYDDETLDVCSTFYNIFSMRVSVDAMKILVAGGNNELNTVFASKGAKVSLSVQNPGLEAIVAQGVNVFSLDDMEVMYDLHMKREEIEKLFADLDAEILIILREGSRLLGLLALGNKRGDLGYDEYDKTVFNNLYPYFFVFGYYMSNIANASVVGTVNREIKMSAQIIKSIQENMDPVENPKMDLGYLMLPAHNIGGEFVDSIRLNETRHLLVVGALSGKGISASMNMVILKSIIRVFLATTHDFKKLVSKINKFIRFDLPKGTFFAGVFCLMDFETDTLYYINCGISTMLLYTRSFNNVIEIQGKGFVLGFAKDVTPLLKVRQIKLNPGDVLGITTEGIIKSHSLRGDRYGKDNIRKSMTENYMYDGTHMVTFLLDDLKRFIAKDVDEDITVMMIRYLGKDSQTVQDDEGETENSETPFEVVDAQA